MADGSINPSNNDVAESDNIANDPLLSIDPIVVMENGGTIDTDASGAKGGADDLAAAAAVDLSREHTVSLDFALCASVLYAVVTSLVLWLVADRPQSVVWAFSIVTSSYLALWTVILAETMTARTVFVSVSYIALGAAAIAHLSPRVAMAVMHLDTAYAAGLLGYALAEHRQLIGGDRSAAASVPLPSSFTEEELKKGREATTCTSFCATIVSLVCIVGAACLLRYTKDTYWIVFGMSFLVDLALYCWTCILTLQLLHGVLLEANHMTTIYLIGPESLCLLEISVSYLFGRAIGTLVYSLGMICMAGLFGYNLGVYAHYKHLVTLLEVATPEVRELPLVQTPNEKLPKQEV